MTEHAVVIAGGGPTGLMLAGELALAGIDVVIVERRTSQDRRRLASSGSSPPHHRGARPAWRRGALRLGRAGLSRRTGSPWSRWTSATSPPATATCWGSCRATSSASWPTGWSASSAFRSFVAARWWASPRTTTASTSSCRRAPSLRAQYLVGCDGGRSLVRKAAGIDFPGLDPSTSWMIAEVEMDGEPELGFRRDSVGQHALGPAADRSRSGSLLTERDVDHAGEPTLDELRDALVAVYGTDFGLRRASWISRFTDMSRQAASYRSGRVLLAGDAAHIHPPQGGQGMGTGVQDAVNLGWKLAQVVDGTSPESLLDTYHAERHPVGARVLQNTRRRSRSAAPTTVTRPSATSWPSC